MIPFKKPYMTGRELSYNAQAHASSHLSGDGDFTKKCLAWLEAKAGAHNHQFLHGGVGDGGASGGYTVR